MNVCCCCEAGGQKMKRKDVAESGFGLGGGGNARALLVHPGLSWKVNIRDLNHFFDLDILSHVHTYRKIVPQCQRTTDLKGLKEKSHTLNNSANSYSKMLRQ
jgi:hypothetical protein